MHYRAHMYTHTHTRANPNMLTDVYTYTHGPHQSWVASAASLGSATPDGSWLDPRDPAVRP